MALVDGEYDLDISSLLENSESENNFALRYGFIPDSMDQSRPLSLYQNAQQCLLKANSMDKNGSPIVFEGINQPYRANNHGANDQYYLSFHPETSGNVVHLKKLNSTIRLSKSRNTTKLLEKIDSWEKNTSRISPLDTKIQLPKIEKIDKSIKSSEVMNNRKVRTPSPNKASKTLVKASKRPPKTSTTPARNDSNIITESDFEDLDDVSMDEKAKFSLKNTSEVHKNTLTKGKGNMSLNSDSKQDLKIAKDSNISHLTSSINSNKSFDAEMDDDFKDLEDQLKEVLEKDDSFTTTPASLGFKNANERELQSNTATKASNYINNYKNSSDDESDSDDYHFSGPPIVININEGPTETVKNAYNEKNSTNKDLRPMSLRDLMGSSSSKKNYNDESSSEEE